MSRQLLPRACALSLALAGTSANAAPRALVVAIEKTEGAELDADATRHAIARELRRPVLPPTSATAAEDADAVLVAITPERVVVSLRSAPDRWTSRSLRTQADAQTRIRLVAWLAGNLGRDQSLVSAPAGGPRTGGERTVVTAPTPAEDVSAEPAAVAEPAPSRPPPALEPPPVKIVAASAVREPDGAREPAPWQVGLYSKTAVTLAGEGTGRLADYAFGWQMQVTRHGGGPGYHGLQLDLGPSPTRMGGLAGILGTSGTRGLLSANLSVAAGVELVREPIDHLSLVETSSGPTVSRKEITFDLRPAFYLHPAAALAYRVTDDVYVVASLGAQVSTSQDRLRALTGLVGARVGLR